VRELAFPATGWSDVHVPAILEPFWPSRRMHAFDERCR
jgi:hypothetical protein